ncbi:MAG: hypothetical protein AABZ39_09290 [Spirochaetota bacterium]
MTREELLKKTVWDYDISADDLYNALTGKTSGWPTHEWALIRAIERLSYYELLSIVPLPLLAEEWPKVRERIHIRAIREGLDYAVRKYALSAAK